MKRFFVLLSALIVLLVADNACLGAVTFTNTPTVVSNTYSGYITLQVTGLTSGDTVVVQKFADFNSNGVIDAGDVLVQQFNLTDGSAGMVISGVTNNNVPGDTDGSANGSITAKLNFPGGDFTENIIGNYFYVLSSPAGHFSPQTNSFAVTNVPFAQKITGNVVSSGTNVPYATIILFPAPRPGHDLGNPVAGTVANSSGTYTILVPTGTYVPVAFKSNYFASYTTSPVLTLTNTQIITTNLFLTNATATISGKVVDANNTSIVLPGLFEAADAQVNGQILIAPGTSDTNGNFTIGVTPGQWQLDGGPQGLALHGYVAYNDGTNVTAPTTGIVVGFHKATSFFYGSVKDSLGNPMVGIPIEARDQPDDNNDGTYDNDGYSDTNGNYVTGAVGGLGSDDTWQVDVDNESSFPNYLFSQPALDQNGGTNLASGIAVHQNFTVILATNHISGNVQFNGSPVVGVQVDAYATIGGVNYNADSVDTDSNGNYSLNVANGTWNVNVYDCGCSDSDSLNNILGNGTYQGLNGQNVTINNNNGTANFNIEPCDGVQILTASPLPDGTNGVFYDTDLEASSCYGNFNWSVDDPADLPPGLTLYSWGEIEGTPIAGGPFSFTVQVTDNNNNSTNQSFSLYIAPGSSPLQITTSSLPEGTNDTFYSQTLQASGGTPPYSWAIADYSADPPPNLTLATNGVLSGTPSATPSSEVGSYLFDVVVTDAAANSSTNTLSLYIVNPPLAPLVITNISLPNGNVGAAYSAQLGATGGQSPYYWSYYPGSANLSSVGLTLDPGGSGLISGTPTTNRVFSFKVQVTDSDVSDPPTNKVLSITINSKPVISSPGWQTNRFFMLLNAASNQNYTLQMSTNLAASNWTSLFTTNNATTNSFIVIDPNATNKQRFYRVLIGP